MYVLCHQDALQSDKIVTLSLAKLTFPVLVDFFVMNFWISVYFIFTALLLLSLDF